jgi:hypothetical protein
MDNGGRIWTSLILLRIRRLGVRVPPSAPGHRPLAIIMRLLLLPILPAEMVPAWSQAETARSSTRSPEPYARNGPYGVGWDQHKRMNYQRRHSSVISQRLIPRRAVSASTSTPDSPRVVSMYSHRSSRSPVS